jgi:hypothetical protein
MKYLSVRSYCLVQRLSCEESPDNVKVIKTTCDKIVQAIRRISPDKSKSKSTLEEETEETGDSRKMNTKKKLRRLETRGI